MAYFAFIQNDLINGQGKAICLNEDIISVEITEEVYNNLDHYMWDGSNVVINPNYDKEQEEKEKAQFRKDFFNTSLGWVRRAVHMKDGNVKDFLSDILPLLQVDVPIITYNEDKTQNVGVLVTTQFIEECKQQVLLDFYGALANGN